MICISYGLVLLIMHMVFSSWKVNTIYIDAKLNKAAGVPEQKKKESGIDYLFYWSPADMILTTQHKLDALTVSSKL